MCRWSRNWERFLWPWFKKKFHFTIYTHFMYIERRMEGREEALGHHFMLLSCIFLGLCTCI